MANNLMARAQERKQYEQFIPHSVADGRGVCVVGVAAPAHAGGMGEVAEVSLG